MANAACGVLKKGVSVFFEYDTPKIVHIRSKVIGIVNRIIQAVVIIYIIVWVLVLKKGYQQVDTGISGTTTKVKGVAYPNISRPNPRVPDRVWDAADIVIPAEENNAFFVMTNMIVSNNQTPGVCPESSSTPGASCTTDADCLPIHKPYLLGHGVTNGTCDSTSGTCFVKAWCPVENDTVATEEALLKETKDFTVLIKNHVYFPFYKKSRSNILESANKTYLKECNYDVENNYFCPVFTLGYILDRAQEKTDSKQHYDDVAKLGGVFSIRITWDCNFDYDPILCKPTYDFDRLDKAEDSLIAKGYNFRYSNNYFNNDREYRQQIKAYGLLFIITVNAKAGAFNPIPTLQNIGSGLALLAVATILCDVFVLYIHKKKKFFKEHKYEQVKNSDAYEIMDEAE